jgi:hypothetical protein
LDAAILPTPAGGLVPVALVDLAAGRVTSAAILHA